MNTNDNRVNVYLVEKLHFSLPFCHVFLRPILFASFASIRSSSPFNLRNVCHLFSIWLRSNVLFFFFFFSTFSHFYPNPFLDEFFLRFFLSAALVAKCGNTLPFVNIPSICILHDVCSTLLSFFAVVVVVILFLLFSIAKFRLYWINFMQLLY